MKILFVTRGYPSESNPMLGNYEAVQARAMVKQGHQVIYMCISTHSLIHSFDRGKISFEKHDGINICKCKIIVPSIPKIYKNRKLSLLFKKRMLLKAYNECIKRFGKPDVIHSHTIHYSEVATIIKDKYNIPLVFTEHWSKINTQKIDKEMKEMGNAYYKADSIIAVSKALSDNLKKFWGVSSVVINNMVEDHFFKETDMGSKDNSSFRFISVGSLIKRKGYAHLINAFHKTKFNENVYLDIVGDGEEKYNLQTLIDTLGLNKQITLHGLKDTNEVSLMMSNSNAFVLSSYTETFGIVLIEAMAKGLPVVSTICGGPEEFVTEECGILVPPGDEDALSSALLKIKENNQYNSSEIKDYCYNNFSQEVISNKILKVYQDTICKKNCNSVNC